MKTTMSKKLNFLKTMLFYYEDSLRRTGRTTHLIEEAKRTGSTIVCRDAISVKRLMVDYGVKAISLSVYQEPDYHRGRTKRVNYLFDSPAEDEIIRQKLKEAELLLEGNVNVYSTNTF